MIVAELDVQLKIWSDIVLKKINIVRVQEIKFNLNSTAFCEIFYCHCYRTLSSFHYFIFLAIVYKYLSIQW
jgi:hypothetical protein